MEWAFLQAQYVPGPRMWSLELDDPTAEGVPTRLHVTLPLRRAPEVWQARYRGQEGRRFGEEAT